MGTLDTRAHPDPFGENPNLEPSRGQTSWLRRVDDGRSKERPRCCGVEGRPHFTTRSTGFDCVGNTTGQRGVHAARARQFFSKAPVKTSCFALLPGRITSSACFTQTSRACSLHNTIVPSGDGWNNCCTQPCQTNRGLWPPYHWQWVEAEKSHSGPVGPTSCT